MAYQETFFLVTTFAICYQEKQLTVWTKDALAEAMSHAPKNERGKIMYLQVQKKLTVTPLTYLIFGRSTVRPNGRSAKRSFGRSAVQPFGRTAVRPNGR